MRLTTKVVLVDLQLMQVAWAVRSPNPTTAPGYVKVTPVSELEVSSLKQDEDTKTTAVTVLVGVKTRKNPKQKKLLFDDPCEVGHRVGTLRATVWTLRIIVWTLRAIVWMLRAIVWTRFRRAASTLWSTRCRPSAAVVGVRCGRCSTRWTAVRADASRTRTCTIGCASTRWGISGSRAPRACARGRWRRRWMRWYASPAAPVAPPQVSTKLMSTIPRRFRLANNPRVAACNVITTNGYVRMIWTNRTQEAQVYSHDGPIGVAHSGRTPRTRRILRRARGVGLDTHIWRPQRFDGRIEFLLDKAA
eukprot:1181506-Prorocentrum_minimum.AAC.1